MSEKVVNDIHCPYTGMIRHKDFIHCQEILGVIVMYKLEHGQFLVQLLLCRNRHRHLDVSYNTILSLHHEINFLVIHFPRRYFEAASLQFKMALF